MEAVNVNKDELEDLLSFCMICCQQIRAPDLYTPMHPQFQSAEKLSDLFKVFCKYMTWEPGLGNLNFNFARDPFPFCPTCKATLISIYRMNGILQNVLKEIHQITTDVLAKLLHSRGKNDEINSICESIDEEDERKRMHLRKVKMLRNFAFSRCSPTVRVEQILKSEGRDKEDNGLSGEFGEEDEFFEPIEVQSVGPDDDSMFLEGPVEFDGNVETEGELTDEDRKEGIRSAIGDLKELKEKQGKKVIVSFGGKLYSFNYEAGVYKCSMCDFMAQKKIELLKHAGKEHFAKPKDISGSSSSGKRKEVTLVGKKYKVGRKGSKIIFGQRIRSRVHQIEDRKFVFDKKFPFELNAENKWYCCSCDRSFFNRYSLEHHLLVRRCRKANMENINDPDVTLQSEESGNECEEGKDVLMFDRFPVTCSVHGWKCGTCEKIFDSKKAIQQHVLAACKGANDEIDRSCVETEENKFLYCNEYPFEFTDGSFKCGTCETSMKTQEKMLAHISKSHIEKIGRDSNHLVEVSPNQFLYANKYYVEKVGEEFRCCTCSYTTKLRHSLTKHLYYKHLDERKHICDSCGKSFQMMCQLRTHQMRIHKGDKYYKKLIHVCDICGKLFGNKTEWRWHTDEHKDVNTVGIPCEICGNHVYKHKMRVHIRGHERKFECTDCNKRFTSKWYLSVHLKTHGGAKPFACDICDRHFSQKSSIRKHKIKFHDLGDEDIE